MQKLRKKLLMPALLVMLLSSGCATNSPNVVKRAAIPPPAEELMETPETASLPNVQQLLDEWTELLRNSRLKSVDCKATPAKCA